MDGSAEAEFTEFMLARWPRLVRLGYGLTGDQGLAEDLAQTALAKAFASWPRVRRAGNPDAYVRRIMVNANSSRFRKRRVREQSTDFPLDIRLPHPVDVTRQHDDRSALMAAGALDGVTWSDVVHVGPWGYCLVLYTPQTSGSSCLTAQSVSDNALRGMGAFDGTGTFMDGTASSAVAYVVGTLTDGGTVRSRAVAAGGLRFWAWVVPPGQRLLRVVFYSASGRQVAVQSGYGR